MLVEQRFRNLETKVAFHRVPYRLIQFHDTLNHDRSGVYRKLKRNLQRQNERQSQLALQPGLLFFGGGSPGRRYYSFFDKHNASAFFK